MRWRSYDDFLTSPCTIDFGRPNATWMDWLESVMLDGLIDGLTPSLNGEHDKLAKAMDDSDAFSCKVFGRNGDFLSDAYARNCREIVKYIMRE